MRSIVAVASATLPGFIILAGLQGCASHDTDALTVEELGDFSELADIRSTRQQPASRAEAPKAESVLHRMNPVTMTKGQASGIIYGTCLSTSGLDYISKQLDRAVLEVPDMLSRSRIGLNPERFSTNSVSFFVFATAAEARAARKIVFKQQRSARQKDPAIYLACDETNTSEAPVIQRYVELYLDGTRLHSLALGIGAMAELTAKSSDPAKIKTEIAGWHQAAKQLITAHPRTLKAMDKRPASHMTSADEILARSFAAYIIKRYGMKSAVAAVSAGDFQKSYSDAFGQDFSTLQAEWLKQVTGKTKFTHLSQR